MVGLIDEALQVLGKVVLVDCPPKPPLNIINIPVHQFQPPDHLMVNSTRLPRS